MLSWICSWGRASRVGGFTWGVLPMLALVASAMPAGAAEDVDRLVPVAAGQLLLVPSFEACSYYFRPSAGTEQGVVVEFRRKGETAWKAALAPVSDLPAGVWKGSLFDLTEDTAWEVRVRDGQGRDVVGTREFRTWSSRPPIAKVIDLSTLPSAAQGVVISEQGTPEGWIKYTAPRGWRLEVSGAEAAVVLRRAKHVILEGVTIVGGARHGVLVEESEAVRILNCDISGWGRVGVQQFTNTEMRGKYLDGAGKMINYDAGVAIVRSAATVVERCYLHDPRLRANSWMFSHPAGPTAIFVNATRGGNVVRWNDCVGSDEHRWNDVIEASSNSAADGGFFRDSDISGNYLAFANDDGVELEGGGMNVRFYRNRIEGTLCSISTGACILGPQFVYRNLVMNPGDENGIGLVFFKNGHGAEQGGKRHFINNTLHGPFTGVYGSYGKPAGTGRIGFMRNNVFVAHAGRSFGDWARRDDFDYDVFWAAAGAEPARTLLDGLRQLGQEAHGTASDPQFAAVQDGDFRLAANSALRGRGGPVANLAAAGGDPGALADDEAEVPYRPLALRAAPRRLDFAASTQGAKRQVTLTVPATAREAVEFAIRKNRVFTWFDVTPASGRVEPGKSVTLTVTVDAAQLKGRPRFKGAFLVATPSGLSRPVSVYAAMDFVEDLRPAAAPNSVYVDAAGQRGFERFAREAKAAGVRGGKVAALRGSESAPEVDVTFTVARAGAYSLLARAALPGGVLRNSNFAVRLDEAAAAQAPVPASYNWSVGPEKYRAVYVMALGNLAAGEHRLRVRLTSGELNLNELIVTDQPAAFFVDEWNRGKRLKD